MADPDVDDIFSDFQYKVKRKEAKEEHKEVVEEKPKKIAEKPREPVRERLPPKKIPNYEKIAYIAIILVLVGYVIIDFTSYHAGDEVPREIKVTVASNTTEEDGAAETNEAVNETVEEVENETVETVPEKTFSGVVTLSLDKVDSSVSDSDSDLGYIEKVFFTIDNDKDAVLMPLVNVYIYDSELDESWETRSRGSYKGAAIKPGDKLSASISISPKTFRNLNIEKSIRIALNDTEEGFVTSANENMEIS